MTGSTEGHPRDNTRSGLSLEQHTDKELLVEQNDAFEQWDKTKDTPEGKLHHERYMAVQQERLRRNNGGNGNQPFRAVLGITRDTSMINAAKRYSDKLGWKVFPLHTPGTGGLCTCGKIDCANPGKHPRTKNGFEDASGNHEQITHWWSDWAEAGIGCPTGKVNGFFVLDVDVKHGGDQSLRELIEKHGELPDTRVHNTGGGGKHYFFRMPGETIQNSSGKVGPGLDIRGDGGYVVLPPSHHASGNRYLMNGGDKPILDPPQWLLDIVIESSWKQKEGEVVSTFDMPDKVGPGTRNATLFSLSRSLCRKGISYAATLAAVQQENMVKCAPPLDNSEIILLVKSAFDPKYERGPTLTYQHKGPVMCQDDLAERMRVPWHDQKSPAKNFTDLGNAERFLELHNENVRYCTETDTWHIWNGRCWEPDRKGCIMLLGIDVVREILNESALPSKTDKERDALREWSKKLEQLAQRKSMLQSAEPYVAVYSDIWDSDPNVYNLQNGTLEINNLAVREHRKSDMCSKCAGVIFDENATCPKWEAHLKMVFEDDALINGFQELMGYSLLEGNPAQIFIISHGSGKNGKSVTFAVIAKLHGDYAASIPVEAIMVQRNNDAKPRPEIVNVVGSRFITTTEGDRSHKLSEAMIKAMTGGEAMSGRKLYEDQRSFKGNFKIYLSTNHLPEIRGTDEAIWRRIIRFPFTQVIPESKRRPFDDMVNDLCTELPGILNWMIAGLVRYKEGERLNLPAAVTEATKTYRDKEDVFGRFLDEMCIVNPGITRDRAVSKGDLHYEYIKWAENNGEEKMSKKDLNNELLDRGNREGRDAHKRYWVGIRIKTADEIRTGQVNL
jgi:putative DNA primase/helicase